MSHPTNRRLYLTAFPLARIVEIDETYIGGKEANRHAAPKNPQDGKAIVLGMRERGGKTKAINISGIESNTLLLGVTITFLFFVVLQKV